MSIAPCSQYADGKVAERKGPTNTASPSTRTFLVLPCPSRQQWQLYQGASPAELTVRERSLAKALPMLWISHNAEVSAMSADHLRHSAQLSSTTINSFKVACVVHSPPTSTLHPGTTVLSDDQQVGAVRKADANDDHVEIPGGERSQHPLSGRSNAPVRERCLQDFFAPSGHHNPQRICRRQDLRTLTRGRIDPFGVDPGPERLGFSAGQRYLAIPALGVDSTPRPQVQAGHVLGLRIRNHRFPGQVSRGVVSGGAPQVHRVLAGHHRHVALVIGGGMRAVPGGEHRVDTLRLESAIHMQATHRIVLARNLSSQRTGTCTGRPDNGGGVDAFSVFQRHALRIHASDARAQTPGHTQLPVGAARCLMVPHPLGQPRCVRHPRGDDQCAEGHARRTGTFQAALDCRGRAGQGTPGEFRR